MLTSDQANAIMQQQYAQAAALQQGQSMGMMPQPMPGASMYPPQFSYGASQNMGAQAGALAARPISAALGTVPSVVGGIGSAAGIASMFGYGGAPMAALGMLDPFMAAYAGGAAGMGAGGLGMAAGGALLGGGAVMAGIGALSYTGRRF